MNRIKPMVQPSAGVFFRQLSSIVANHKKLLVSTLEICVWNDGTIVVRRYRFLDLSFHEFFLPYLLKYTIKFNDLTKTSV